MGADDYFNLFAVLLGIYAIFRVIIWLEFRNDFQLRPRSEPSDIQNHPIDTFQLTERVEKVRRDYAAEAQPPSPVKSLLIEERRVEIAKLAFFQPPPAPEPPEHEQGLILLTL